MYEEIFTIQCYSSTVYAIIVCLSVSVCICVSVTLQYYIKTAKCRIMQIMLHDSPLCLFLCVQSSSAMVNGGKRWRVGDFCMAKYWQDNEVQYCTCHHISKSGSLHTLEHSSFSSSYCLFCFTIYLNIFMNVGMHFNWMKLFIVVLIT